MITYYVVITKDFNNRNRVLNFSGLCRVNSYMRMNRGEKIISCKKVRTEKLPNKMSIFK